jgi:hypothetical protein
LDSSSGATLSRGHHRWYVAWGKEDCHRL